MKTIARAVALFAAATWGLLGGHAIAQDEADDGAIITDTHRFKPLADGVYHALYTLPRYCKSNSMVVNNDEAVVVVAA
ncbi:MAG: hypothetical protein F4089_01925, partial [Gammaproteobacteria bacterium]|nr:hypothetical protein [Gammaproteobacteria bacterium]